MASGPQKRRRKEYDPSICHRCGGRIELGDELVVVGRFRYHPKCWSMRQDEINAAKGEIGGGGPPPTQVGGASGGRVIRKPGGMT